MEPMKPMEPMNSMEPMKPMQQVKPWWPDSLGNPDSTGGQNSLRYAYFAGAGRLLVDDGGKTTTYDTGGRKIQGFGQQQGRDQSLTFSTDAGQMSLADFRRVD